MAGVFWLSDRAWSAIEPLLPSNQPGARRVDDRRVISGIVHVLKAGCRWKDCPAAYGPPTTVYNRFNRWSRRGLWGRIFAELVAQADLAEDVSIDSTASGRIARRMVEKGGAGSGHRALAWRSHHENPRPDRWVRACRRASAHTR
jgi:transposase